MSDSSIKSWLFAFGVIAGAIACLIIYIGLDALRAGLTGGGFLGGLGACGFAIGGGLCFLGVAIMHACKGRDDKSSSNP